METGSPVLKSKTTATTILVLLSSINNTVNASAINVSSAPEKTCRLVRTNGHGVRKCYPY